MTTIIRLSPAQPCGVGAAAGRHCQRPASLAYLVEPSGELAEQVERLAPGHLLLLPVCPRCAEEMAALYQEEDA